MTDTPPLGGMTFPGAPPGFNTPPQPQPQQVPTIPPEFLAWGAGVRADLAAIAAIGGAILKLLREQRDLALMIAKTAGEDAQ